VESTQVMVHPWFLSGWYAMHSEGHDAHLISMPLPATSVATRMSLAPCFRLARAYSLQSNWQNATHDNGSTACYIIVDSGTTLCGLCKLIYQFLVYYGVSVHEGDVVMMDGRIMREPKTSALSTWDCYYIGEYTNPVITGI